MTGRRTATQREANTTTARAQDEARTVPSACAVLSIVVRAAGIVPIRLELSHAGTPEAQVGMMIGAVLVYLRSAVTARAVAEQWAQAATHARCLTAAIAGRRTDVIVGPSTVGALVRLAGIPDVTAAIQPARPGRGDPTLLRLGVGPVTWEICDATAYSTMLRAWHHAARLLEGNPGGG